MVHGVVKRGRRGRGVLLVARIVRGRSGGGRRRIFQRRVELVARAVRRLQVAEEPRGAGRARLPPPARRGRARRRHLLRGRLLRRRRRLRRERRRARHRAAARARRHSARAVHARRRHLQVAVLDMAVNYNKSIEWQKKVVT